MVSSLNLPPRSRAGSTSALPPTGLSTITLPHIKALAELPRRPATASETVGVSTIGAAREWATQMERNRSKISALSVEENSEVIRRGSTGRLARMVGFGRKKSTA
jgi:hypothetical protein